MKHIYWVGIKESEIQMCSHLFEGSITFIGSEIFLFQPAMIIS